MIIATFSGMPLRIIFSDPSSSQIVEQKPLIFFLAAARLALRTRHNLAALLAPENADSRRNTCQPPSVPEIFDGLTIVSRKDKIIRALSYSTGDNQLINCFVHRWRLSWNVVLCFPRFQKDNAGHRVELPHAKIPYLSLSPSIAPSGFEHCSQPWPQFRRLFPSRRFGETDVLSVLQETLPNIPLFQHPKVRDSDNFRRRFLYSVVVCSFEQRQLSVDSSILGWSPAARGLRFSVVDIPFDQIGGDLHRAEMPEERLKMVSPTRLIILNALIAVVLMAQEKIVHQLLDSDFLAIRGGKTDRVLCQFPPNEGLSFALIAAASTATLSTTIGVNLKRPDATVLSQENRPSSTLTLHWPSVEYPSTPAIRTGARTHRAIGE
jgi:hypothetical protein